MKKSKIILIVLVVLVVVASIYESIDPFMSEFKFLILQNVFILFVEIYLFHKIWFKLKEFLNQ